MKFRQHLSENIASEYGPDAYLAYERLDEIIRFVSQTAPASADLTNRQVSLSMPPPTNAQGVLPRTRSREIFDDSTEYTDETFLKTMDEQMAKVERFTLDQVTILRSELKQVESKLTSATKTKTKTIVENETDKIAEDFLRIEKYVNINFMGFHKILKKHDKHIPSKPIKAFYVNRMHGQSWVRGDYSDVVVRLSSIYSSLRNDQVNVDNAGSQSQSFLRSTTKYWVKTEDVSRVKYAILRHLPVFLQKTSTGESDSQMTNSVYLDNDQLELYHGRLDKSPGAIALRLRWYGAGDPKVVFVERKTHREKWTGEVSVKERFIIDESEVHQVMTNTYDVAAKKSEMLSDKAGKSQEEVDEWETLSSEITQVISSKQLVPTMRTQYMRTAFQIPFDATVRVSLDTNLCMISERGYDLKGMRNWHRDPSSVLAANEITRFPHAVLEIKLELKGNNMTPPKWVTDLQNSGMLYEVHKFSKFIHGCAVMLPEDVRSVPYWVDDASIRESIIASEGQRILVDANDLNSHVGPGSNQIYNHLLPFGHTGENRVSTAVGRTSTSKAASAGYINAEDGPKDYGVNLYDDDIEDAELLGSAVNDSCCEDTCLGWVFPCCTRDSIFRSAAELNVAPTSVQKIEPKVFFANERTYLHWLHHSIVLASVASGILAFTGHDEENRQSKWGSYYALTLLTISLCFCVYSLHIFLWRAERIKTRVPGHWDDPRGPLVLGFVLVVALTVNFVTKVYFIATTEMNDTTLREL